jgi:hypothetical protein
VLGHTSRCLYAVWSNPAPGVTAERFREYYEDVHRPDTLAIGHFERSFRYESHGACRARYLTLWEAEHPDLASALERVRKGALALREQGRIWPVQEVVFHQFLFAAAVRAEPCERTETLTTVQNDWRMPASGSTADAWATAALPAASALRDYDARYLYACAGRYLWLGETSAPIDADTWRAYPTGLPPLGRATPIFPDAAPPESDDEPLANPHAQHAAWVVHWRWIA